MKWKLHDPATRAEFLRLAKEITSEHAIVDKGDVETRAMEAEIRAITRNIVPRARAIGFHLIEIQKLLVRGQYLKWVEENFGSISLSYEYRSLTNPEAWRQIEQKLERPEGCTLREAIATARQETKPKDETSRAELNQRQFLERVTRLVRRWPKKRIARLKDDQKFFDTLDQTAKARNNQLKSQLVKIGPAVSTVVVSADPEMVIKRKPFLEALESLRAGLGADAESASFAFNDGRVSTFNGEAFCTRDIGLPIDATVPAAKLFAMLEKLQEPKLTIRKAKGELQFWGKGQRCASLKIKPAIELPTDEMEPTEWQDATFWFIEAMERVRKFAWDEKSHLVFAGRGIGDPKVFTNIHIHPDFVETCDDRQLMRIDCKTGVKEPILVSAKSLGQIVEADMRVMAVTPNWIHFRNVEGLRHSYRRFIGKFPKLDHLLPMKNRDWMEIPRLKATVGQANVFAQDTTSPTPIIRVKLKAGRMKIAGESDNGSGWFRTTIPVKYKGPQREFSIGPEILRNLSEESARVFIGANKLEAVGLGWVYVAMIGEPQWEYTKES